MVGATPPSSGGFVYVNGEYHAPPAVGQQVTVEWSLPGTGSPVPTGAGVLVALAQPAPGTRFKVLSASITNARGSATAPNVRAGFLFLQRTRASTGVPGGNGSILALVHSEEPGSVTTGLGGYGPAPNGEAFPEYCSWAASLETNEYLNITLQNTAAVGDVLSGQVVLEVVAGGTAFARGIYVAPAKSEDAYIVPDGQEFYLLHAETGIVTNDEDGNRVIQSEVESDGFEVASLSLDEPDTAAFGTSGYSSHGSGTVPQLEWTSPVVLPSGTKIALAPSGFKTGDSFAYVIIGDLLPSGTTPQ